MAARPLEVVVVPGGGRAPVVVGAVGVGAGRGAQGLALVDGGERGDGPREEEDAPAPALYVCWWGGGGWRVGFILNGRGRCE